ncbi:MAG: iron/manganese transporter [Flavobacterium sp. BFFFF2]|nr:MAG: iron/manganese transporter [Flavobacterium sp. BFFFF2]
MSKSLEEVHGSIGVDPKAKGFRAILAFFGPAYMISVGYMDPGNWATDLAGGSQFGYALLWVLAMSNAMALLLQSLSARLGVVTQHDLAQASRESYPKNITIILYVLAEVAIAACDLAEVLGMAIGLHLLTGCSLLVGVLFTVLDTFLLLFLINKGIRKMEAFIIALIAIIGCSFVFELYVAQPDLNEIALGFIPSLPNDAALYIAIGIIGATVMPHNLYLHSSLVQTRRVVPTTEGIRRALKYNFYDSFIALNLAFFVNAAILILAASAFFNRGMFEVAEIQDAHRLLAPLLGSTWAPILFAVALIAAGQSSTITGTLAGQIIMEGYLNLRIQPWVRRIITRLIAIVPAVFAIVFMGDQAVGKLLIFSQVILSIQLGFAIIPLIHFVSDPLKMKGFEIKGLIKFLSWLVAFIIVGLNLKLVYEELLTFSAQPNISVMIIILVWLFAIGLVGLLFYLIVKPLFKPMETAIDNHSPHLPALLSSHVTNQKRQCFAITVDFSDADEKAIHYALDLGGKQAQYLLIHVVESVGAIVYGNSIQDHETHVDEQLLKSYQTQLRALGYQVDIKLGYGNPKQALVQIVNSSNCDILVMGTHGHKGIKDWVFGTTVNRIRHRVQIPVLLINK